MGDVAAVAVFAFIAEMSKIVTALLALGVFVSGLLILTGIGGQGVQKHVRGAFLAIFMGAWFCFGANKMATKFAADFQAAADKPAEKPAVGTTTAAGLFDAPIVYDVRQQLNA